MTQRVDIEMCRVALRGLIDYWFSGERDGARFSIPIQANDADVLLSKALDELQVLRERAEEVLAEAENARNYPQGSGWAWVCDKLRPVLGGDAE